MVHFADVVLLADKADAGEHLPEQPCRGVALTERVFQVGIHVVRVQGQPVHGGAVGGEPAVIDPKGGLGCHGAGPRLPVPQALGTNHRQTGGGGGGIHIAGSHDNSAVHGAGIADQIGAGQEGTHGVAQQKIGKIGKFFVGQLPQLFHVLRHPVPAAFGTEVQPGRTLRHGQAVSQMVVAHHGEAPLRQVTGIVLIPQHILRYAVGNLQNSPRSPLRQPFHSVNGGFPIGGWKGKFTFYHGNFLLCMIESC